MPNQFKRLTVVEKIYHQIPGSDPTGINIGFTRHLQEDEEPYLRSPRKPVPIDWTPLDLGWIAEECKSASCVVIRNLSRPKEPVFLQEDDEFIYIKYKDSKEHFTIAPQEAMRFTPSDPKSLVIRSSTGKALFSLVIFPG